MKSGTEAGSRCDSPVNLIGLYTTLIELAGLPVNESLHEPSLVPLLQDPKSTWPHLAVTQLMKPDNYSISGRSWRYIHYDNGDEELYDTGTDPYEWTNLAGNPEFAEQLNGLKLHAPQEFAPFVPADPASLVKLDWHPADGNAIPASKPEGNKFDVTFSNQSGRPAQVFLMGLDGKQQSYGVLETEWSKPQSTRPGDVWMIADNNDQLMGYFEVGDREARAIIPAEEK